MKRTRKVLAIPTGRFIFLALVSVLAVLLALKAVSQSVGVSTGGGEIYAGIEGVFRSIYESAGG